MTTPHAERPRSLLRHVRQVAGLLAGAVLLAGGAYYLAFHYDPPHGVEWRRVETSILVASLIGGYLLSVLTEFDVLCATGLSRSGIVAVFRVTALASLSTYLGFIAGMPARLILYRTTLGVGAANGTATFLYLTAISTAIPALLGVALLAPWFPALSLASGGLVVAAGLILVAGRAGRRSALLSRIAKERTSAPVVAALRFAARTFDTVAQFPPMLTVRVSIYQVGVFALFGLQAWLALRLWSEGAPLLALVGVQAGSFVLGRLSGLPLGLGAKDVGFVALLVQLDVDRDVAVGVAALDRASSLGLRLMMAGISLALPLGARTRAGGPPA